MGVGGISPLGTMYVSLRIHVRTKYATRCVHLVRDDVYIIPMRCITGCIIPHDVLIATNVCMHTMHTISSAGSIDITSHMMYVLCAP